MGFRVCVATLWLRSIAAEFRDCAARFRAALSVPPSPARPTLFSVDTPFVLSQNAVSGACADVPDGRHAVSIYRRDSTPAPCCSLGRRHRSPVLPSFVSSRSRKNRCPHLSVAVARRTLVPPLLPAAPAAHCPWALDCPAAPKSNDPRSPPGSRYSPV